jgi:pyridoxal 5'-phosphate synthase pdxS subunit
VFVGSGIFKSSDPERYAQAIVDATMNWQTPDLVAKASRGLGEAMPGLTVESLPEAERLARRGW